MTIKVTSHESQLLIDYINKLRDELPAGFEPLNDIPAANIQDLIQVLGNLERAAFFKD
jgi:hypothetical protein